ncbi:GASH domain-containing protein [Pseudomonas chlororaphis]|uniref:GTPase-associated system all-helical protein GASH n=1 Tax=Pseudomonas TaxID=286 RepID=UPI000D73058C|nr:GTPase-associated system all-helical protein GASH [Pseudomonas sp. RW409]PWY53356.1 hypothetical protein DK261_02415 [Pseudomonas sp. RW409]
MDNIAVHMRISGVTVNDDDVNSRRSAATSLATSWGKEKTVSTIISKAADIAEALGGDGNPPSALGDEIQKAIQKKSSSFLYEERPLDVSVCAGMAMVSLLDVSPGVSGWSINDVYATALWSALAYQPVLETERRENLRREVLNAAADWVATTAETARERMDVQDPSTVSITIDENNVATSNFKEAMANTIEALRRNAALDREELDFLWWAQLGRSRLLNRQLSAINEPTRIVAAGVEGARMLRRLPCEVHREIVLRTLDQDPELDLAEMLAAVGDDRTALAAAFIQGNITSHPTVFPLLHALATGEVDGLGAAVKRRVSEWGERALLEAGFARMMSQGASKL